MAVPVGSTRDLSSAAGRIENLVITLTKRCLGHELMSFDGNEIVEQTCKELGNNHPWALFHQGVLHPIFSLDHCYDFEFKQFMDILGHCAAADKMGARVLQNQELLPSLLQQLDHPERSELVLGALAASEINHQLSLEFAKRFDRYVKNGSTSERLVKIVCKIVGHLTAREICDWLMVPGFFAMMTIFVRNKWDTRCLGHAL